MGGEPVGALLQKPDGSGLYFADAHRSGGLSRLHLVEITWGRLVDIHAVDALGAVLPDPVFRDFVVNENVQTDTDRYLLETNPITQKTRLVVRRTPGAPDVGAGTFESLLVAAALGRPGILPKSDAPTESPPFSFVVRNGCLVLHFDDLLEDGEEAVLDLPQTVRVLTGYPPARPLEPRVVFDPNHGGVAGGRFHSTRILIDLTVSEAEAADSPVSLPVNSIGFPASDFTSDRANAALRLPTRTAPGAGQFALLRNLSGAPLDGQGNGPIDLTSPAQELVRAVRAGNETDPNNGFLLDFLAPRVVGSWPCTVDAARPLTPAGFDWSIDITFTTVCQHAPASGDILAVGETFLEVAAAASAPDAQGSVPDVRARVLNERAPQPSALVGGASFQSLYDPARRVDDGCWIRFTPQPRIFPAGGVSPFAQTTVRFSEPMDPASVKPFDSFLHVRGGGDTGISTTSIVVGSVRPSLDLREFTFTPTLPFAHEGDSAVYHARLPVDAGVTDLAGNGLARELPALEFSIDPDAPRNRNSGFALRFASADELEPFGFADLRGQFTYDLERGTLRARPVAFTTARCDRVNPVVSIMAPFAPGVQTPLSGLGSKLQFLWRYADLGWSVRDETKFNIDVVGLYWSPARGQVVSDFFEQFEMRLSHSYRIPDEKRKNPVTGGVKYPMSGLRCGPAPYTDNILVDPLSPQVVVHHRSLGYRVDPVELTLAPSGMPLIPFPMNRAGGAPVAFTWRDTSVLALGGPDGAGVPLSIEVGEPLFLENNVGSYAENGHVPAACLPLLMEIRCYPSQNALGLNPLAISLASNISARPNFRAFSTGGINTAGQLVTKNPDLELAPTGGFNPSSRPPGKPTQQTADNALYLGQLDYVTRVSRAHSIWLDTKIPSPRFAPPVLEPTADQLPPGTLILIDYRGADGFLDAEERPFIAAALDAYGDLRIGTALFHGNDPTWKPQLTTLDGSRYIQFRVTALNNVGAQLSPELSAIGIAYENP